MNRTIYYYSSLFVFFVLMPVFSVPVLVQERADTSSEDVILPSGARYPQAQSQKGLHVIFWQEFVESSPGSASGLTYLSMVSTRNNKNRVKHRRFFPLRRLKEQIEARGFSFE